MMLYINVHACVTCPAFHAGEGGERIFSVHFLEFFIMLSIVTISTLWSTFDNFLANYSWGGGFRVHETRGPNCYAA